MENILIKNWQKNAQRNENKNLIFLKRLKLKSRNKVDKIAQELHEEAFEKIDCKTCANCCKTISPIFKKPDIERLAAKLKMRESEFIEKYLKLDEDGDYVANILPCPFLQADNLCSIYEIRPRDCKDYPHTHKSAFAQRTFLHHRNTLVCPAVFHIVEQMQKIRI